MSAGEGNGNYEGFEVFSYDLTKENGISMSEIVYRLCWDYDRLFLEI